MKKVVAIILVIFCLINQGLTNEIKLCDFDYEDEIIKRISNGPIIYIDLRECLLLALLNSSYLKAAFAYFEKSKYNLKYAYSELLPNFGFNGYIQDIQGQLLVGGALIEDLNEVALYGGVYITHDLTRRGQVIFNILSKKNLKRAQGYTYKGTYNDLLREVAISYYELIEAKLTLHNLLTSLCERKYQYEIANARYEVGEGDKFDKIRCEIEINETEIEIQNAIIEFKAKQAKLARYMGVEITSNLMPVEVDLKLYELVDSYDINETYNNALNYFPKIKELEANIASLKNQRNQYFSDFIPNLSIDAHYSYQGTARQGVLPNFNLMFKVDIPIGDRLGVGTWAKIRAMDKEIEAKEYELKYQKSLIKENITVSFIKSKKILDRIKIYKKEIDLTEKSTNIATGRFLEGEGSSLTLFKLKQLKRRQQ